MSVEPIDRDTCVEVLKIVIRRMASADFYEMQRLNLLAIESVFELCGDEALRARFHGSRGRESVAVFRSALHRILDVEITDLFYEVAELVYNHPEPVIN